MSLSGRKEKRRRDGKTLLPPLSFRHRLPSPQIRGLRNREEEEERAFVTSLKKYQNVLLESFSAA